MDKEEGELKKRLRNMCPPYEEVYLPKGNEEVRDESTLLKLVDEAKKEIEYAIFSGTDLELRKVIHKWFGSP